MSPTVNDANDESRTTNLAQWTTIPVLGGGAVSCGTKPSLDESLDEKDARTLQLHAERIAQLRDSTNRAVTTAIIEIGAELAAAHALLAGKGREGRFAPWCRFQGFSKSTAYRAIAAYEAFGKCPTLGHFFDPQAVYLLSAESCPEEATAEALQRAEDGDYIDHKRAKEIVSKHAPRGTTGPQQVACRDDVESVAEPVPKDMSNGKGHPHVDDAAGEIVVHTHNAGATTPEARAVADGDVVVSTANAEQQTASNGLAGLQAVIAALESLGVYAEYQQALDRIQAVLERNAGEQSEETAEWTF